MPRFRLPLLLAALFGLASARAEVAKQIVFASGDAVPEVGADARWADLLSPFLGSAGHLTVQGDIVDSLSGTPARVVLVAPPGGEFQLLAKTGDLAPVPQTPTAPVKLGTFNAYGGLGGRAVLIAPLVGAGVTQSNNSAFIVAGPGGLELVARKGTMLPGMNSSIGGFTGTPRLDEDGGVTFSVSNATSTASPNWSTFRKEVGNAPQFLSASHGQAILLGSRSGFAVVTAKFSGPSTGVSDSVRRLHPGKSVLIAQLDAAAPGLPEGWKFTRVRGNSCNDSGQVLVAGTIINHGQPWSDNSRVGLWMGDGASALELIGLSGDTIPGTDVVLQEFNHSAVNAMGDVAFFSGDTLCLKRRGEPLQQIARSGMALPPSAGDASFGSLFRSGVQLSANGSVVFQSSTGLWIYTGSNRLLPIALTGEAIEHGGHAYKIGSVTLLGSGSGGQDGRRRMVSDTGAVAFLSMLDSPSTGDRRQAVIRASVPYDAYREGAPTAHPDLVNIRTGPGVRVKVAVLANDIDPQDEPLTIFSVSSATVGTVEIVGKELRYIPNAQFTFEDRFTYTVKDLEGFFSTAEVIVRRPLPRLRGSYATTFGDDPASGGKLTITLGANGQLTGRLQVGARTFTFRGLLAPDGTFTRGFAFGSNDPITLTLQVGPADSQTPQLTGTVETTTSGIRALAASPAFGLPHGVAAQRLTMQLRAPANPGLDDPGFRSIGFAIGKLTAAGRVTLVGRLLDNRPFTAGAAMKRDGTFILQAAPYGIGGGRVRGNFAFGTPGFKAHQWVAELDWSYIPPTPASVASGFETTLDAAVASYHSTPDEPNYNWEWGPADLQILWEEKTYREISRMEKKPAVILWIPNGSSTLININRHNGLLVGSFAPNPDVAIRKTFRGAIYLPRIEAAGIVPHPTGHGFFMLKPPGLW